MKSNLNRPQLTRLIKGSSHKKNIVAEIERKSQWSDEDVNLVITHARQWVPEVSGGLPPFEILVALAFDVRTPDNKAKELQQLVQELDSQKRGRGQSVCLLRYQALFQSYWGRYLSSQV